MRDDYRHRGEAALRAAEQAPGGAGGQAGAAEVPRGGAAARAGARQAAAHPAGAAQHAGPDAADPLAGRAGGLRAEEVQSRHAERQGVLQRVADRGRPRRLVPQPRAVLRPHQPLLADHQHRGSDGDRAAAGEEHEGPERGQSAHDHRPFLRQDVRLQGARARGHGQGPQGQGQGEGQAAAGQAGAAEEGPAGRIRSGASAGPPGGPE